MCLADIKAVRKRKQKLKDLEGIDTSNIIGESRGRRSRTSASFFAPQRSEPVDLGDEDEDEDEEEEQESDSEEGISHGPRNSCSFHASKKPNSAFNMSLCLAINGINFYKVHLLEAPT